MKYSMFLYKDEDSYIAYMPDVCNMRSRGASYTTVIDDLISLTNEYCQSLNTMPKVSPLSSLERNLDLPEDYMIRTIIINEDK